MASVTTRKNGSRFITFRTASGQPKHITLGKVAKRYAESFKVRVEDLASAAIQGHAPSDDTARWLAVLEDDKCAKLSAVDLVAPRQVGTVGCLAARYISNREGELKPESIRKLKQTETKLLAFFGTEVPLRRITPQDAADWRSYLKSLKLSEASIRTHCGNAKAMFTEGMRCKLVSENPFAMLKSGSTPSKYSRYVTPVEIDRVIEACPDAEWRLLFGLARYAGLRVPSETHGLTWADVDLDAARLTVRSPKTERFDGCGKRVVPITKKLMRLLEDRRATRDIGQEHLVTIRGKGAVIRQVRCICRSAGVELWEKLWQTLRSSCEREWAMSLPQYAVSKWIGHSTSISERHYTNGIPDELFDRAAGRCPKSAGSSAQRNAQLKAPEAARNGQKAEMPPGSEQSPKSGLCGDLRDISASRCPTRKWSRGESNPSKNASGGTVGAIDAHGRSQETPRDLAEVVASWHLLAGHERSAVVTIVRAATRLAADSSQTESLSPRGGAHPAVPGAGPTISEQGGASSPGHVQFAARRGEARPSTTGSDCGFDGEAAGPASAEGGAQ